MADFDRLDIPSEIPVLPLDGLVIFPYEIAPLAIRDPREIALAEEAAAGKKCLGFFCANKEQFILWRCRHHLAAH